MNQSRMKQHYQAVVVVRHLEAVVVAAEPGLDPVLAVAERMLAVVALVEQA